VLDFGLAKLGRSEHMECSETVSFAATATGSVMGTVGYMSPEQARGEVLDARTDLFSVGAVLYEMAAGKPAFAGATAAIIFNSILTASPTPVSRIRGDVPPELESIISRALEKDRKARYQSAAGMKTDLKRLQRELESRTLEPTASSRAARRNLRADVDWRRADAGGFRGRARMVSQEAKNAKPAATVAPNHHRRPPLSKHYRGQQARLSEHGTAGRSHHHTQLCTHIECPAFQYVAALHGPKLRSARGRSTIEGH